MCGRYALGVNAADLIQHFQLKTNLVMKPRYNIAPQEVVPVLKKSKEIDFLRWGFTSPFKAAANAAESSPGFINIRAETADEKPSFKQSLLQRRCLVPVTGYYEWKKIGRTKQPYYIKGKNLTLFALAGLWVGESFGILTVASNALLMPIHERMPVILPLESYEEWMHENSSLASIKKLLVTSASEHLEAYPVSPKMNYAGFDSELCIQPL